MKFQLSILMTSAALSPFGTFAQTTAQSLDAATAAAMQPMIQQMNNAAADLSKMIQEAATKVAALGPCKTKVDAQEQVNMTLIRAEVATKQLSPFEVRAYEVNRAALAKTYAASKPPTVPLCEIYLAGLKTEYSRLLEAAKPMAMPECSKRLEATEKEMVAAVKAGRARNMMTIPEETAFLKFEADRRADWENKKKGGITINECRDHLNGLEAQKLAVDKMVASR